MIGKPTDGPISRYINRKLSMPISRLIIRYNKDVSPNLITILTTILGILSGVIYLLAPAWLAGIIVQIASILDGVDGEIARATNKQSPFGGFLDSLLDRLVDISIIICISLSILLDSPAYIQLIILFAFSMLALSGSILVSFMNARSEASLGKHPSKMGGITIATRDIRLFIIFIGSLITVITKEALIWTLGVLAFLTYLHVFLNLGIISSRYLAREIGESIHTAKTVEHNDVCRGNSSRSPKEILEGNGQAKSQSIHL